MAGALAAQLPSGHTSSLPLRLQLFSNTAAALPAELDEQGQLKQPATGLTAWQRRMQATAERRRAQREQQQAQQQE